MNVRRYCTIFSLMQEQMEVVRHDAVAEHIDRELLGSLVKKPEEILIVGLVKEQLSPVISTIRDVNGTADGQAANWSWRG